MAVRPHQPPVSKQGTYNRGIWSFDFDGGCPYRDDGDCKQMCDEAGMVAVYPAGSYATDCAKALDAKCKTLKAFSILGVVSTAAALALSVAGGLGTLTMAFAGAASTIMAAFGCE